MGRTLSGHLELCLLCHKQRHHRNEKVFTSIYNLDETLKTDEEQELTGLIREASYYLYGKRGIRFSLPRPGINLSPDEFLIPSFVACSKKECSGSHYVLAVSEYPWVLNDNEI